MVKNDDESEKPTGLPISNLMTQEKSRKKTFKKFDQKFLWNFTNSWQPKLQENYEKFPKNHWKLSKNALFMKISTFEKALREMRLAENESQVSNAPVSTPALSARTEQVIFKT